LAAQILEFEVCSKSLTKVETHVNYRRKNLLKFLPKHFTLSNTEILHLFQ